MPTDLRGGQFEQLTEDHSLADALVRAGTISKDEVANHKFKNVLYLYLGSKDARGVAKKFAYSTSCRATGSCLRPTA